MFVLVASGNVTADPRLPLSRRPRSRNVRHTVSDALDALEFFVLSPHHNHESRPGIVPPAPYAEPGRHDQQFTESSLRFYQPPSARRRKLPKSPGLRHGGGGWPYG